MNIEQQAGNNTNQVGYVQGDVYFNRQQQPNFNEIIGAFLQKELKNDNAARLESAGQDFDNKISLARVFVDLPATNSAGGANMLQGPSIHHEGIVGFLLLGSEILCNKSEKFGDSASNEEQIIEKQLLDRVVIVGGPGQGKSTLCQFLCQLYRAAILKTFPSDRLAPEVSKIIELLEQPHSKQLQLPTKHRIPIRIILNEYASDLAKDEALNLLQYISNKINSLGNTDLSIEILKQWLSQYAWLIIFDGLDEVPPSSNRTQVLKQIDDFLIDAANLNADLQIIAATRPQSYSHEFAKESYKHWYLTPLSSQQALDYGHKLIEIRCGDNEQRQEMLLRRLEKACETEATAKLMQSPLQVTIMVTLVEVVGEPPKQRYQLFKEYYQTIYNRERGREGPLSEVLSKHKSDIDTIHYNTGLLLQTKSEIVGNTEARLTNEEFQDLVKVRLLEDEHPEKKIDHLLRQMTDGSLQRLVFLIRPVAGQIAFEIRSLQEFMAAEALLNGRENDVIKRLTAIAPIGHWHNVFLFAVGKCFVEKEHLLDNIYTLCQKLNDTQTDAIAGTTLWGARIALNILIEGIATQKPKYERLFIKIALQLLTLPDTTTNIRLAWAYHDDLADLFQNAIKERFAHRNTNQHQGAWALLKTLADHEVSWALELLNKEWPANYEKQKQILEFNTNQISCSWILEKVVDVIPHCKPSSLSSSSFHSLVHQLFYSSKNDNNSLPDWMEAVVFIGGGGKRFKIKMIADDNMPNLELISVTNDELISLKKMPPETHPGWIPYMSAARFVESPTHLTLARELQWLSKNWEPKEIETSAVSAKFAWPIAACLLEAKTKEDLLQLAEKAEKGQLGTFEQWIIAEKRWKEKGVVSADFQSMTDDRWPFDARIAELGFPFIAINFISYSTKKEIWQYIFKQYTETDLENSKMKYWTAWSTYLLLDFIGFRSLSNVNILPNQLQEIIKTALQNSNRLHSEFFIYAIKFPEHLNQEWVEFFNWFCQQKEINLFSNQSWKYFQPWPYSEQLANWFSTQPDNMLGLLNVLGALASGGSKCPVPKNLLQLERYENQEHQLSAAMVRLSQGDWDNEETNKLAQFIANDSPKNRHAVDSSLDVLSTQQIDLERRNMFALALWNQLVESTEDRNDEIQKLLYVLIDAMNNKVSSLGDPITWQKLNLPKVN